MHHKLLASRLLASDRTSTRDVEVVEGSPTLKAKDGPIKQKAEKHVPLNFGLAKIVSLELASDEEETPDRNESHPGRSSAAKSDTSKRVQSSFDSTSNATKRKSKPLERPVLLERQGAQMPPPTTQTITYTHAAPSLNNAAALPSSLANSSAFMSERVAEEQEALAFYLRQRQHSNLQMELEQIRRMQTAMFLYQHTAPPTASLPYLESLLGGRLSAAGIAGELFPSQAPPVATPTAAPSSQEVQPKMPTSAAGASGATTSLLNLAPKRSVEAVKDKPIKERPEEYQHLSKKARRTPTQTASSEELQKAEGPINKKQDHDESSETSDSEMNGHRFRPYQYEQWTEKFQELCDFRKLKGHCQVPHTYKENPPLARWVKRQRYQYKLKVEGKMSTMTDERVRLLENIGFIWDSHAAAWAEKLHELKEYARERGDCNVPSTYPENPQLATWVKCQRRQYKLLRDGKTSNMTVDRIMELEKVGFVWEVRKTWEHTPDGMERVVAAATAANNARQ